MTDPIVEMARELLGNFVFDDCECEACKEYLAAIERALRAARAMGLEEAAKLADVEQWACCDDAVFPDCRYKGCEMAHIIAGKLRHLRDQEPA